jgi:outer membrane protein assembly factor BamD (BamD/ComL family)
MKTIMIFFWVLVIAFPVFAGEKDKPVFLYTSVTVDGDDEGISSLVESYITRELRLLGDVKIVNEKQAAWELHGITGKIPDVGFVVSITILVQGLPLDIGITGCKVVLSCVQDFCRETVAYLDTKHFEPMRKAIEMPTPPNSNQNHSTTLKKTIRAPYEVLLDQGDAYVKEGLYDKAIASYKKAIELNPDSARAHCQLGYAYVKTGLVDRAIESYNKAGYAYVKHGLYDKAITSYKKAIELNPDEVNALIELGFVYYGKGLKHTATDYLYKGALLSLEKGNREGALKIYDFLAEYVPNSELTSKLHRKLYPE